jgi:hypothetical protein
MYRRAYLLSLVCIFGTIGCPVSLAAKPEAQPDVFVLGALHELHKSEESFSFDDLREALLELKADVWVLEVRPAELTARSHTPGRPEYPAVIWPLLKQTRAVAVAMEPGGDEFKSRQARAGTR